MASENSGAGSFFAGFLLGGMVGAALALIFAPQPGEQTVAMIREKGIELKERVSEMTPEEMRQTIREAVKEGQAAAEKAKGEMLARMEKTEGEAEIEIAVENTTDDDRDIVS